MEEDDNKVYIKLMNLKMSETPKKFTAGEVSVLLTEKFKKTKPKIAIAENYKGKVYGFHRKWDDANVVIKIIKKVKPLNDFIQEFARLKTGEPVNKYTVKNNGNDITYILDMFQYHDALKLFVLSFYENQESIIFAAFLFDYYFDMSGLDPKHPFFDKDERQKRLFTLPEIIKYMEQIDVS
jgi:hypothetical protein